MNSINNPQVTIEENNLPIWERQEFSSDHLDSCNIPSKYDSKDVSVVVSTFNRAPHPVDTYSNPLGWCLESLIEQKKSGIGEIIIVDDASTDYTSEVIRDYEQNSPIPIVSLKNKKNKGSSVSRNLGAQESNFPLVHFLDDDCIFNPYMVFGGRHSLVNDSDASIVHLPVYHRAKKPKRTLPLNEFGVLNLINTTIGGGFDAIPEEYTLDLQNSLSDSELDILKPLEVQNIGGVFLTRKEHFLDVGGFPDYFTWRNGYREETDVAIRMKQAGHKLIFTPDPKFGCTHLKYGFQSPKKGNGRNT